MGVKTGIMSFVTLWNFEDEKRIGEKKEKVGTTITGRIISYCVMDIIFLIFIIFYHSIRYNS